MPEGVNLCWCEPIIVHLREYRNPRHEYEVQVPDGIAEILGCTGSTRWALSTHPDIIGIGTGFKISLAHPNTGEGELGKIIWVAATGRIGGSFQKLFDDWSKIERQDSERIHATDLRIDEPEQTSLSLLPALHLKLARTEPEAGRMVYEVIVAESPGKDIAYQIGLVSPVDEYEKNQKLFKAIVDGFSYVPSG
jgi:hypothetical protein